jgi:predicted phage tail protein
MTFRTRRKRELVALGTIGALAAAALVTAVSTGPQAEAVGTNAGALVVKTGGGAALTTGGSSTQFTLAVPVGAACTGDSATGGYRVQSFIVPAATDLSLLTFNNSGPVLPGAAAGFKAPLYSNSSPFTNKNTAVNTGFLPSIPLFDFGVFLPGDIPAGDYSVGLACSNNANGIPLDKYWSVGLTFATNVSDSPAQVTWTLSPTPPPTTTTSSTTSTTTTLPATTTTTVAATVPGAPAAPTGTVGKASVLVKWTAPASNGGAAINSYVLQKSAAGGAWSAVTSAGSASTRQFLATGLVNGTAYRFRVAAHNSVGNGAFSAPSASLTPRTVPTAPRTPTATGYNASALLTWVAPASTGGSTITGYIVQRSPNGTTWTTLTASLPTTARSYTSTGLKNGTTYKFRVIAKNVVGNSPASAVVTAVPKAVPSAPGKPAAVTATTSVKLTWTAPTSKGGSAITAYRVQRSLDGITWVTVTSSASAKTRTCTVTGLTKGKAYRFRVAAINSFGVGNWSAITAATPH